MINTLFYGLKDKQSFYREGNKIISYNTCIVEQFENTIIVNMTYYSKTTSKNRNIIIKKLKANGIPFIEVEDVPKNAKDLYEYR